MVSFARKSDNDKETLIVVANMAGVEREFEIGVPADGRYLELFNSDNTSYGGKGLLNQGRKEARRKECDGRNYSISIEMAPVSLAIFGYTPYTEQEKKIRAIKEEEELKKEKEREETLKALKERQSREEQKLLEELKLKYEKELLEQEKAIEEKYEKIEEDRIFCIVTQQAVSSLSSKKTTAKKTTAKKAPAKKPSTKKTSETKGKSTKK
jgi:1,4-alpha-glucan branching enzyme